MESPKKAPSPSPSSQTISTYQKILLVLAVILIIFGIWYANNPRSEINEPLSEDAGTTSSVASQAGQPLQSATVELDTYKSATHAFQFNYTSDWKQSTIFNLGAYQGAVALVPAASEAAMKAALKPNSASIIQTSQDQAIFVRIVYSSSINNIVSMLYGNGVVVTNSVIGGKNVAHVVHSKSSDPANWSGGSTEAYIFRNTLGEALVVEADYSAPEPETSGAYKQEFQTVVSSFKLTASQ